MHDNGMLQAHGIAMCQLGFMAVRNILSHMIVLHSVTGQNSF